MALAYFCMMLGPFLPNGLSKAKPWNKVLSSCIFFWLTLWHKNGSIKLNSYYAKLLFGSFQYIHYRFISLGGGAGCGFDLPLQAKRYSDAC